MDEKTLDGLIYDYGAACQASALYGVRLMLRADLPIPNRLIPHRALKAHVSALLAAKDAEILALNARLAYFDKPLGWVG